MVERMYFRKLEVYGFKSFVDKTTLLFEPGVTAIVGPNGTGKSNIADAIKWVLGEQSAKSMRGSKMEDVIFNGTESRPPVNMAEVSLTLSNEGRVLPIDYDEVTISRRLYRSGESEYLLNKTPVRLKDVHELLMGTGIGTESYSLLEQGRIDVIISSKPEDRRVVFEEASGITKYKKKKDEAMRKLEQTEENLLRVNDIVVEVNRQLNSIQRQVNKARRYQEQFEQLKTIELEYAAREYQQLRAHQQALQTAAAQHKARQAALEQELAQLAQVFEALKQSSSEIEAAYTTLHNRVASSAMHIEKNEHAIALNRERAGEFRQRIAILTADIDAAARRLADLEAQCAQVDERLADFQQEKQAKEDHLRRRQACLQEVEAQRRAAEDAVRSYKERAVQLLSEQAHLKNELVRLATQVQNSQARAERLRREKEKVAAECADMERVLQEKIGELVSIRGKVDADTSQAARLRQDCETVRAEMKSCEKQARDMKEALIAKQSQLSVLEELVKSYEGFSGAVKMLLTHRQEHPDLFAGVQGALADLIDVKAGYEVCVESAFGDYLQAVVVDTRQTMERLQQFIEAQGLGRVRLLSLDGVAVPQPACAPFPEAHAISEVVVCEPRYRPLVECLLANTFLTKSIGSREIAAAPTAAEAFPRIGAEGVEFRLDAPQAAAVAVVGDFNDWIAGADSAMERGAEGGWSKKIKCAPGRVRYKFVVDGAWGVDPSNTNSEVDFTGNINSFVDVPETVQEQAVPISGLEALADTQRVVTLDGAVYGRYELVSRPSAEQQLGLISQKASMRKLRDECQRMDEIIVCVQAECQAKEQALARLHEELSRLQEALNQERIALANRDSEQQNLQGQKRRLEEEFSLLELELDELERDQEKLLAREQELRQRAHSAETASAENEALFIAAQAQVAEKTQEREQLVVVITEMKTECSLLNDQEASLQSSRAMLRQSCAEQQRMRDDGERQSAECGQRVCELTAQTAALEETITRLRAEHAAAKDELEDVAARRERQLTEYTGVQQRVRNQENSLQGILNSLRDGDVKGVELNFKLENLMAGIRQSYKLELAEQHLTIDENIDWVSRKAQIEEYKERIERMGSVNLAAVEEEAELRQRAQFLTTQKDDLLNAKTQLMQAIQKINRTTRELFLDTFEKTKVTFKEYFRLLFNGGDAQL
ncbi:MAG: chromosome segregation protein SMC, partial [Candidatus Omnitrophica bacterium]|nr:chromosome segregation protein SMC [Candidatus Omnitrophota bacterium]